MLLEIFACLIIAIGIFGIYNLIESKKGDRDSLIILVISFFLVAFGIYILIRGIEPYILIKKIIGIFLLLFSSFMIIYFPGTGYMHRGFRNFGILFGLFLMSLAIYILLF
jgi:hypothetical protein